MASWRRLHSADVQLLCGHLGACVCVCMCMCPLNSAVRRAGTSGTQCFCSLLQQWAHRVSWEWEGVTPTK